MKRFLIIASVVSALVAFPLTYLSMTIAYSSSGVSTELLLHPGFWIFYLRAWAWFAASGVICSAVSYWIFKRKLA